MDQHQSRRHVAVGRMIAAPIAAVVVGGAVFVAAGGTPSEGLAPSTTVESVLEHVPGAAVGRVADTEMFAAVLVRDEVIRVYLCNGTVDEGTVDDWFEGPWDGSGPVTLEIDNFELTVAADGDAFIGELRTVDGHAWPFRAEPPQTSGAGLYRKPRTDPDTGEVVFKHLVILDDGAGRGTFAPVVTRCYYRKRVRVLADGTTQEYYVQICV